MGLSGAGKTTTANYLISQLKSNHQKCILLDGDILRNGINKNLGFTELDRFENVRRTAEIAKLFVQEGYWVVVAMITPYEAMRSQNREILGSRYIEIFVDTSLAICKSRDPKGFYAKAARKEVANFTGIDAPFEYPKQPDLIIYTEHQPVEANCEQILSHIAAEKI